MTKRTLSKREHCLAVQGVQVIDSHSFGVYFREPEINHCQFNRKAENMVLPHEFCEQVLCSLKKTAIGL